MAKVEAALPIQWCRVCGSKKLTNLLSLGDQYLTSFSKVAAVGPKVPLTLLMCRECKLVQLHHTCPREWLYSWYGYRSGVNASMRRALHEITTSAGRFLRAGDTVIDIGSNDGTLLRSYSVMGLRKIGFEPALNLLPEAREGLDLLVPDYFNFNAVLHEQATVITAIAMFYDLDDPVDFLSDVSGLLAPGGVLIVQMNHLLPMVEGAVFDNISHEHVTYYSLATFTEVAKRAGLEVFDVELNDVNGGSFRAYCRNKDSGLRDQAYYNPERISVVLRMEERAGLDDPKTYEEFGGRVNAIVSRLQSLVRGLAAEGKKIYVYGASTRGLVVMQACGIDSTVISGAAERNREKWGRRYDGTGIICVSEQEARARADYFLVLPWQFVSEFLEREKDFLQGGGKFIVPLPEVRVIGAEDLV